MTSVSSRPLARLSSPGDVVATIPSLCGFRPQDSLVVLSLRGPRRRLGLTIRIDLPPPALVEQVASDLAGRVLHDGGSAVLVVVYAERSERGLVEAVRRAYGDAAVRVVEALHVTGDRWTSYLCDGPCCPAEGTPLGAAPSLLLAEQALDGRAVLPSRAELVRSLAPSADPAAADRLAAAPRLPVPEGLAAAQAALQRVRAGQVLPADTAAVVTLALHDVQVRDEVATWALEDAAGLLALCEQLARQAVPPFDAPVCTVLAWVAYARGDGARANVALDRALRADPQYALALLLQAALDGAVPPAEVRRTLEATAQALQPRRVSWPG